MRLACVLLLLMATASSCASASANAKAQPPTETAIIDALWRYHTGVVRAATAPEFSINGDDFARSIQFLEKVTGIYSDTPNWAGRVPTGELPNTLSRWEAWYAQHHAELRLSDDGCGVAQRRSH